MMTAAQRFIKRETLSAIIKMIKIALCLNLFVQRNLCVWNYDGYLLAMSVDIYAFVQVRKKGLVATVELSYCIETWASTSPSRLEQVLQHALIARRMRESKNSNLAVIAMRKYQLWLLLYLEHFGSHRMPTHRKLWRIKPWSIGWLCLVGSTLNQTESLKMRWK